MADPDRYVPRATYRLQFHAGFGFDQAREILPYLKAMGFSDLYASPFLKARAGSTHGYDITDHAQLNPELGGQEAFDRLAAELKRLGMGLIMDFVPNHMGIFQADNGWWLDVLEWGRGSAYAGHFDIDWQPAKAELKGKVLVPVLGDHYGAILEQGDLKLAFDAESGAFDVWYWEHRFPITPPTYTAILLAALREADPCDADLAALELLVAGFRELRRSPRTARAVSLRRTKGEAMKRRLAETAAASPGVAAAIDAGIARFAGTPGDTKSWRPLHALLEEQNYRLAFWRVASDEINYRRFFQINDLAGIRIEIPEVFEDAHAKVFELVRDGAVTGIRIDHIDGLFAPRRYLNDLQDRLKPFLPDGGPEQFGIWVEKIMGSHESLREGWPVAGTTGYEFCNQVTGVLVDPAGERSLNRAYGRMLGASPPPFDDIVYQAKRQVMDQELAAELNVLANELNRVTEGDWNTRDFTLAALRTALREVVANFPVYRTYVNTQGATADDLRDIDWAIARARKTRVVVDASIYEFLRDVLTTQWARVPGRRRQLGELVRIARKFQQYTGPVTAKGVEDTAFYRYNLLIALNEVGGHPSTFGLSVPQFHRQNLTRAKHHPLEMLGTATHDTKRGEDTRARITAISEFGAEWARRVRRWRTLNRRARREVDGQIVPHPNDEYLFYQALVGVWPVDRIGSVPPPEVLEPLADRLVAFMMKALKEAKLRTSWTSPEPEYEEAMERFVRRVLDAERTNPFLTDFAAFHALVAPSGACNGLAQVVLKVISPGLPDTYQGCELWDDSLVDPDNRRPVNFALRRRMLDSLSEATPETAAELLATWGDGRIKMHVLRSLLALREQAPALLRDGAYTPLEAEGTRADNVIAFARSLGADWLVTMAPRMTGRLRGDGSAFPLGEDAWGKTRFALPEQAPAGGWRNLLTGEVVECRQDHTLFLADLTRTLPLAVLVPEG